MSFEVDYYALDAMIRAAREKKGLTQDQLCKFCLLSTAHVGYIERGARTTSTNALCATINNAICSMYAK